MGKKRTDALVLLSITIIFIASITIIPNSKNKSNAQQRNAQINSQVENVFFSPQEILNYINPLIYSKGVEKIAQTLIHFDKKNVLQVMSTIIDNEKSPLSREEKILLLFALVLSYSHEKNHQYALFSLLKKDIRQKNMSPVLFVVAKSNYATGIQNFLSWLHDEFNDANKMRDAVIEATLDYTIEQNDLAALENLVAHGTRLSATQATNLLKKVVRQNKDILFVPFLVQRGANIDYYDASKKTLLMQAVENKNKEMVTTLLRTGANTDLLIDPIVGTALQIAVQKGYNDIALVIRNFK